MEEIRRISYSPHRAPDGHPSVVGFWDHVPGVCECVGHLLRSVYTSYEVFAGPSGTPDAAEDRFRPDAHEIAMNANLSTPSDCRETGCSRSEVFGVGCERDVSGFGRGLREGERNLALTLHLNTGCGPCAAAPSTRRAVQGPFSVL